MSTPATHTMEKPAAIAAKVDARQLREALAQGVSRRGVHEITEHARIETLTDALRIVTTDYAMTHGINIDSRNASDGALCAHVGLLRAALNGLDGEVCLDTDQGWLVVRQGRRRFTIPSLAASDFPAPDLVVDKELTIDPLVLKEALRTVAYAGNKDDADHWARFVWLTGTHIGAGTTQTIAVYPQETGLGEHPEMLMLECAKTVQAFLGEDTAARVYRPRGTDNRSVIEFYDRHRFLRCALGDVKPPDWRRAIQAPVCVTLQVSAAELRVALARVAAFAWREQTKSAGVHMSLRDGVLVLEAPGEQHAEDTVAVEITQAPDGAVEWAVDAKLLTDALAHLEDDAVTWRIHGDAAQGVHELRCGHGEGSATHIVAGMRR